MRSDESRAWPACEHITNPPIATTGRVDTRGPTRSEALYLRWNPSIETTVVARKTLTRAAALVDRCGGRQRSPLDPLGTHVCLTALTMAAQAAQTMRETKSAPSRLSCSAFGLLRSQSVKPLPRGTNGEKTQPHKRPSILRRTLEDFLAPTGRWRVYQRVNALLKPSSVVLDVGCGRGKDVQDPVESRAKLRTLRGKCASVIGIDSDVAAAANPAVDEFRHISGKQWPVDREAIDLCLVDSVLEHVSDPDAFFAECRRVVKPGGYLCIRTPNSLG